MQKKVDRIEFHYSNGDVLNLVTEPAGYYQVVDEILIADEMVQVKDRFGMVQLYVGIPYVAQWKQEVQEVKDVGAVGNDREVSSTAEDVSEET